MGSGVGVVITGWCKLKVRVGVEIFTHSFFSNDFYFSFVGPLLDIVILCSRPDSCCQQNLNCFDMPLLSFGLFSRKSSNDC